MVNFVNKNVFFYWTITSCVIRLHWNQVYIELNMGKFPWILILPLLMVRRRRRTSGPVDM